TGMSNRALCRASVPEVGRPRSASGRRFSRGGQASGRSGTASLCGPSWSGNSPKSPEGCDPMSEMYEGVVFCSDERTARRVVGSLVLGLHGRLVRLARGVFGISRVAGGAEVFDQPAVERIASRVSTETGSAVALFYDNSCASRVGVLYSAG